MAGEVQEGGDVPGRAAIKLPVAADVGPVTEAFGPEFEAGKQAVDVRHSERLLDELGVRWPHVVQGGQEERRDAQRSVPALASPLAALPTQLAQRHRCHGKRREIDGAILREERLNARS